MSTRPIAEPSAKHPITVRPTAQHVSVRVNGELIADTNAALTLQEATYPGVQYIPMADVVADRLRRSDTTSYCPYKGEASYYSIVTPDGELEDATWTYEQPYPAVADIGGHVAFYPDKADITVGS